MDLAEAQAILDNRMAVWFVVSNYVCGIQQTSMPKCANGATLFVCVKDASAELGLVQSLLDRTQGVYAFCWVQMQWVVDQPQAFVKREDESLIGNDVGNDIYREHRNKHRGFNFA